MPSKWITVKEAAEIIGIKERAVRGRLERRTLAGRKIETPRGEVWEVLREAAEGTQRTKFGRKSEELKSVKTDE